MKNSPRKIRSHSRARLSASRRTKPQKAKHLHSHTRRASRRKSPSQKTTHARVAQAIALMRRAGLSLARASTQTGVNRNTVVRLAGSSLRKLPNGRFVARANDRLLRVVRMPTADGIRDVSLRNSRDATLVGEYWNAVHAYLAKGDAAGLERFRDRHITTADRERIVLLIDRDILDRLGSAGVLSFESMYAKVV